MALNQDVDPLSTLVVRMDQNSESDLQALFDSVLKPDLSKRPLQVPLRMRNLPDSFFNPPSTGSKSPSISHSRENSADSAFGAAAVVAVTGGGLDPGPVEIPAGPARRGPARARPRDNLPAGTAPPPGRMPQVQQRLRSRPPRASRSLILEPTAAQHRCNKRTRPLSRRRNTRPNRTRVTTITRSNAATTSSARSTTWVPCRTDGNRRAPPRDKSTSSTT